MHDRQSRYMNMISSLIRWKIPQRHSQLTGVGREEGENLILVLQHFRYSTSWQSNHRGSFINPSLNQKTHTRNTAEVMTLMTRKSIQQGAQATSLSHREVIDGFSYLYPLWKHAHKKSKGNGAYLCFCLFETMDQIGQCLSNKTASSQLKWASFFFVLSLFLG